MKITKILISVLAVVCLVVPFLVMPLTANAETYTDEDLILEYTYHLAKNNAYKPTGSNNYVFNFQSTGGYSLSSQLTNNYTNLVYYPTVVHTYEYNYLLRFQKGNFNFVEPLNSSIRLGMTNYHGFLYGLDFNLPTSPYVYNVYFLFSNLNGFGDSYFLEETYLDSSFADFTLGYETSNFFTSSFINLSSGTQAVFNISNDEVVSVRADFVPDSPLLLDYGELYLVKLSLPHGSYKLYMDNSFVDVGLLASWYWQVSNEGYISGYRDGFIEGVFESYNTIEPQSPNYQAGYDNGVNYANSVVNMDSASYNAGFNAGVGVGDYSFVDLIGAVIDAPVRAFFGYTTVEDGVITEHPGLFSFEIFGVDMSSFVLSLIGLSIVAILLKFILGGGSSG